MTDAAKRKISVTLDADVVEGLEALGGSLSANVNAALRSDIERRERRRALGTMLDRLAAARGPLTSRTDELEIRRYMRLLGGPEGAAVLVPEAAKREKRTHTKLSR